MKKDYNNLIKLNGNESESKIAQSIIDAVGFNS